MKRLLRWRVLALYLLAVCVIATAEHESAKNESTPRPLAEAFLADDPSRNTEYLKGCIQIDKVWVPEKENRTSVSKDPLTSQVSEILKRRCLECHSSDSSKGSRKFSNILDTEQLTRANLVVPGKPGVSILMDTISGHSPSMPANGDALSENEQSLVKQWIEAGAPSLSPKATLSLGFVSESDKELCIRENLKRLPKTDQRNMRYFTFTHLYNTGKARELQIAREAMSMLVNSLSTKKKIVKPEPIDSLGTIFRIDLRDYGWTPADWDLLTSFNPYGNIAKRDVYQEMVQATRTYGHGENDLNKMQPPFLRGDWFASIASRPPLYHLLLKMPGGEGKPGADLQLEKALGVDLQRNLEAHDVQRAGTLQSGVAKFNRLVERHDSIFGYYWKSFDFADSNNQHSIFAHPFDFKSQGSEIIYTLPNGLQAYMLVDAEGKRIDEADEKIVSDQFKRDSPKTVTNGISCMNCHYRGLNPVTDQIRAHVEKQPSLFSDLVREQVQGTHPTQPKLKQTIAADQKVFLEKLAETQYVKVDRLQRPIPVYETSLNFEDFLDLNEAASELGMTRDSFVQALKENRDLSRLLPFEAVGLVGRQDFNRVFGKTIELLKLGEGFVPKFQFNVAMGNNPLFGQQEKISELEEHLRNGTGQWIDLNSKPDSPTLTDSYTTDNEGGIQFLPYHGELIRTSPPPR